VVPSNSGNMHLAISTTRIPRDYSFTVIFLREGHRIGGRNAAVAVPRVVKVESGK
jgi:hypothetical protein